MNHHDAMQLDADLYRTRDSRGRRSAPSHFLRFLLLAFVLGGGSWGQQSWAAESKPASGEASISFNAVLPANPPDEKEPLLVISTHLTSRVEISREEALQQVDLTVKRLQGKLKQLVLTLGGQGELLQVEGEGILDWGLRMGTNGQRSLVISMKEEAYDQDQLVCTIRSANALDKLPAILEPLTFFAETSDLFGGSLEFVVDEAMVWELLDHDQLVPLNARFLLSSRVDPATGLQVQPPDRNVFRIASQPYRWRVQVEEADPELRKVRFQNFTLGIIDLHLTAQNK